jgi:hypothetical protein
MKLSRIAPWLCAVVLGVQAFAAAAEEPDCVVVFSQGRSLSTTSPEANTMWNRLNDAFGQFVVQEFSRGGRRAEAMPYPVEATDADRVTQELVQRASKERCPLLAQVGMYAEQETQSFVSFMRLRRLEFTRMPGGTKVRIGEQVFERVQRDPLTRETLDRLSASDVAHNFVASYLSQAGK